MLRGSTGLEYAGEVMALGPGAERWAVGDRVMGLVGGGAHVPRAPRRRTCDSGDPLPVWRTLIAAGLRGLE